MDDLSLSPLGLFLQAGPVGKSVMALLFAASIWCWLLIVEALVRRFRGCRALCATPSRRGRARCWRRSTRSGAQEARLRVAGETVSERRQRVAEKMTRASLELADQGRGRPRQSRGDLLGLALCRPVRHGLGHHGEFRRHRRGQGHQPRRGRARHRRGAGRHRLWPRRRHSRRDRL